VLFDENEATGTVALDSSLSAGDTRHLYIDVASQDLRVTADPPEQRTVSNVTSPVSVRVVTEGGLVLHSGSMAWGSEMSAETAADSSGGSSGTSTRSTDTAIGSTSSERPNATASQS
jgi:hypothetical protein